MPQIDAILSLKLTTLAPKVVATPTNTTIPLDDADPLPLYGQTNRTIQLDHADLEPMPATNRTIQLGDGDIESVASGANGNEPYGPARRRRHRRGADGHSR